MIITCMWVIINTFVYVSIVDRLIRIAYGRVCSSLHNYQHTLGIQGLGALDGYWDTCIHLMILCCAYGLLTPYF